MEDKCEFCSEIEIMKYQGDYFLPGFYPDNRNDVALISEHKGKFHIWNNCEDSFYSGVILENINYCPMCGRKLV